MPQHQGLEPIQIEQAVLERLLHCGQEGLRRVGTLELQQPVERARAAAVQMRSECGDVGVERRVFAAQQLRVQRGLARRTMGQISRGWIATDVLR
jgi:hypothetical protein